jgi:hypothetical protein
LGELGIERCQLTPFSADTFPLLAPYLAAGTS